MFLSPENDDDDPGSHLQYMQLALSEARQAMEAGGVKGRLLLNEYLDYLTILIDVKERSE